jgi:hypothetical protein
MNNRKSPNKQQRMKHSHPIPVVSNSNRHTGSSYSKNSNHRHYSNNNSPTASSLPAVPIFYTNTYADPPDCSSLPKPPESWYMKSNNENLPVEEKPKRKSNNNNRGFHNPFYSSKTPTPYISVKA